jgi:hypothetical protein
MWKRHLTSLAVASAALVLTPALAEARPSGVRTTARSSVHAGGGGAHRANVTRPPAAHAGGGQRAANVDRTAAGNRAANVNRGATANRSGNTAVRGGDRINTGNVNVGNNVNVNVDADNGWGWGWDDDRHPVAAGVAFGTAAAVTSAAITGARYYSLPPACAPYPYSGFTYYSCGGVYYAPRYEGDTVVYVVVDRPG